MHIHVHEPMCTIANAQIINMTRLYLRHSIDRAINTRQLRTLGYSGTPKSSTAVAGTIPLIFEKSLEVEESKLLMDRM